MKRINHILIFLVIAMTSACAMPSQVPPRQVKRSVDALLVSSVRLIRAGDKASLLRAKSNLELAFELNPRDPRVIDGIGCLEWRQGNTQKAEQLFRQALLFDPFFSQSYVHLATIKEQQGQPQQAMILLEKALQLNPLNHKARNNYASLLYDYSNSPRQSKQAYAELLKAIESAPEMDNTLEYNLRKFKSSNIVGVVK